MKNCLSMAFVNAVRQEDPSLESQEFMRRVFDRFFGPMFWMASQ